MYADMPLFTKNLEVRNFLPEYTETGPRNGSAVRKNVVPVCYEETLNKIIVVYGKENI
jgi:hypothetical protein